MTRVLLTGSTGFIGAHFVEAILKETDWEIVLLEGLNYAANPARLEGEYWEKGKHRVKFVYWDLRSELNFSTEQQIGEVDYVIHLAAESHVDHSIKDPKRFALTNIIGTINLLDWARLHVPKKFIYFSCYDEKTRAVTKDGLKTYKELRKGDIVFTLNPTTKKVEEQKVEKVIVQDYEGEMIKFDNHRIDLLTTPNHRIYQSDMKVLEAKDCIGKKISFPISTGFNGNVNELMPRDLFYLSGIFLGDGFTAYQEKTTNNKSGLSKIERDKISKDNKTGRFIRGKFGDAKTTVQKSWRIFLDIPENDKARLKTEKTLENLGIEYTKQKGKGGEHLYFTSEEWLKFFNGFGKGAKNKFIPDWMLKAHSDYLKELFSGLVDSDGYWKAKTFTTVSDKLADNFCELAIKVGYIPNKQRRYSESIFKGRVIKGYSWQITFAKERKAVNPKYITKEKYRGKIWCITVKNKNFLVERNGKYAFSGNTDEVYGPIMKGGWSEDSRHAPGNPYSASKAGAEDMCLAYANTYKLPIVITNTMNIFGERQHPEKFIPLVIRKVLNGETVTIHSSPDKTKAGSRFYLHARNAFKAIKFILENTGETIEVKDPAKGRFNVVGDQEVDNLALAQLIAKTLGKELKYEMVDFHSSRPGHDLRYGLDGSKLKNLGFIYPKSFEETLKKTINWTTTHKEWL